MADKVVRVKVDKVGAQRDLNQINKALKDAGVSAEVFKGNTKGATGSLSSMIPIASRAAGVIGVVGSAAAAATGALIAFTRANAQAIKEMSSQARVAGLSTQAFQGYAYAAQTVGVQSDKLSDILKDVNDKVGDFVTTGGGEFKDVFDAVLKPIGVTVEQLREMSSAEVLGAVQSGMEQLGANGQEVTFILEAIANDATLLQPLLANNATELNRLAKEARDLGLIITPEQEKSAKAFNDEFDKLQKSLGGFGKLITAEIAPALTSLIKLANEFVGELANAFNLTIDAKIASKLEEITSLEEALTERRARNAKKFGDVSLLDALNPFSSDTGDTDKMVQDLQKLRGELEALEAQRVELDKKLEGGANTTGTGGGSGGAGLSGIIQSAEDQDKLDKALEARKEFLDRWIEQTQLYNLTESELNDAWRNEEQEKLDEWRTLNLDKEDEYQAALAEIDGKWSKKRQDIADKDRKEEEKKKKEARDKEIEKAKETFGILTDSARVFAGEQSGIYKVLFAAQQAYNFASVQSDSIAAIAKAWNSAPFPANLGAVATATVETGILTNAIQAIGMRQSGGYTAANQAYQVGGGAHTTAPEIYSSGGKDYLIDSSAGMMTRLQSSGGNTQASGMTWGAPIINNNGQPVNASVTGSTMDEDGVQRMIIELTPQIMSDEAANPNSNFRQTMNSTSKTQWDYS